MGAGLRRWLTHDHKRSAGRYARRFLCAPFPRCAFAMCAERIQAIIIVMRHLVATSCTLHVLTLQLVDCHVAGACATASQPGAFGRDGSQK